MNLTGLIIASLVIVSVLFLVLVLYVVPSIILSINLDAVYFLAAIVTIFSLIISPVVYFIKRWSNERSERRRASGNICRELKDTLEALEDKKFTYDALSFKTSDDKEVFFMNRFLNHDFYDSLISSGKINFLEPDLQQQIQSIFKRIKKHNEYLSLAEKIMVGKPEQIPKEIYEYYIWMDGIEEVLSKDIPIMIKRLEVKFGNCSSMQLERHD